LIIVEHLEESLGSWLLIEYRSAYNYARRSNIPILFTGIEIKDLPSTKKRFHEILDPKEVVILDPQAETTLTPEETRLYKGFVIGGILGDHPPRGRTKKLLSDKFPETTKRNIGEKQFSIDGAVYVLTQILKGKRLEEIPVVYGVRIYFSKGSIEHEIYLPYAYPFDKETGRVMISKDLVDYLTGSKKEVIITYDHYLWG